MKSATPPAEPAAGPRRFATTRWSVVLAAGQRATSQSRKALGELCALYWPPLYAFARRQGLSAEEAQDLTQGFFTRLLEKDELSTLDPSRGRFRAWLLASLKHYLSNAWAHERAQKRGGGLVRVDFDAGEGPVHEEPDPGLTPERAFERRWALTLLEHVLSTLRNECAQEGKAALFEKLKGMLTGEDAEAYAGIGAELGMTAGAVRVAAHRLRRRYRDLLRAEIAQTVEHPEDVDDEIRFLFSALENA